MTPNRISNALPPLGLSLLGGLHESGRTLYLIGPDPVGFWPRLLDAPEASAPDPVDRYSLRVLDDLARHLGGEALFPFGLPRHPFMRWAVAGGCAISPVGLLVHPVQGLWVSFRGALAFDGCHPVPEQHPAPCDTCDNRPCLGACPAGALTASGYDLDACHSYLDEGEAPCMARGCALRRACPHSPRRPDAQSAHHMAAFHP